MSLHIVIRTPKVKNNFIRHPLRIVFVLYELPFFFAVLCEEKRYIAVA